MVKRISKVRKLVALVKENDYPCSIKMRLGLNKLEKERKVYLNLIDAVDADFLLYIRDMVVSTMRRLQTILPW
jgi:tRNA-dihydrouridine synthase